MANIIHAQEIITTANRLRGLLRRAQSASPFGSAINFDENADTSRLMDAIWGAAAESLRFMHDAGSSEMIDVKSSETLEEIAEQLDGE